MFLGLCAVLALALVPLTGGSYRRLSELRLRWLPLAAAALLVQVVVISVWPTMPHGAAVAGHVLSYLMLAVVVWVNRAVPGMVVIGLGAALNAVAITANDGTLPASRWALQHAGIHARDGFNNSGLLAHPHLSWLGDVMVTPSWLPFRNMLSVGDLVLLLGVVILVIGSSRRAGTASDLPRVREAAGAVA
ncbi:MAG: DUF5317 domain-containing protein [Frankiaceae bacterium]|nr:DUF5317 domain-containing protein [Frankiaceae bacterium]MBV9872072.1 DUF5317 domain-containing protein [Frankiaceae bacterium]